MNDFENQLLKQLLDRIRALEEKVDALKAKDNVMGPSIGGSLNLDGYIPHEPCMHDGCPECHGAGLTPTGRTCIHMISCPCPRCSPMC